MVCKKIFWMLAWSALLLTAIRGHPQCLDFRPPFETRESLSFCSNYTDFGCCTASDDASLRQEYLMAQQRTLSSSEWARCQGYVQELLCQQCSPYAAHIFDAERMMRARTFPGLCTGYCRDFFHACSSLIPVLDPSLAGSRLLLHGETFCQHVGLTDVDYCYPELLHSPQLNTELQQRREQETTDGCLCLEPVGNKLAAPLLAKHAGDGSGRLFVGEQPGVVRILFPKEKVMLSVPFLNITARVETSNWFGDERGFLGLAFHRGFAENGRFFVYYSTHLQDGDGLTELEEEMGMDNLDHKIRISEMRVSQENPNVADVNYEKILLEINQPYANHNGGELLVLEDGYLYIFVGDGGASGDPHNVSQNRESLLGKVLRLDVDSHPDLPYSIPRDNPFMGINGTRPEIFALGVRNIWRCGVDSGDRRTGERKGLVLCGDVGQNAYEELDILRKGANYGWRGREGLECYDEEMCGSIGEEELPVHTYPHSRGKSVTGGQFYRGCESPALDGLYIYGDYMNGRLFSLKENGTDQWRNSDLLLCGTDVCFNGLTNDYDKYILSFGEDQDGEIYMLTSRSSRPRRRDGQIFKFVDPQRRGNPAECLPARKEGRLPLVQAQAQARNNGTSGIGTIPSIRGINMRRCGTTPSPSCLGRRGSRRRHRNRGAS